MDSKVRRQVQRRLLTLISKMEELKDIEQEHYPELSFSWLETAKQRAIDEYTQIGGQP